MQQQFTGLEYMNIDIANQFGMDKKIWSERLDWVAANEHCLQDAIEFADEPILMAKAINARKDALQGIPTGFIMGLDATAQGLQILACLSGCYKTASRVNLVNTGQREDLYTFVSEHMSVVCGYLIERGILKHPIMTTFYGSLAQPKKVFGEGTPELQAFYDVLYKELPGAMALLNIIQSCWDPQALYHSWTLPDDHVSHVKVMVPVEKKVEVDELDHATFTHRFYVNQAEENGLSLAANIVQSIDGFIVREMQRMAQRQGFELLSIHDPFIKSDAA